MKNKITFRTKYKRIEMVKNNTVIDTLTIREFNNLCTEIEIFKANNFVLFEDNIDVISIDLLNSEKFGESISIGDDFTDGLIAINIRALYFYKKDYTYLFYDFIYNTNNIHDNDYGIGSYDIVAGDAISIGVNNHDKQTIKTGYISNAYIKGYFDDEVKRIISNSPNIEIMVNGDKINQEDFWSNSSIVEYDSLFLADV